MVTLGIFSFDLVSRASSPSIAIRQGLRPRVLVKALLSECLSLFSGNALRKISTSGEYTRVALLARPAFRISCLSGTMVPAAIRMVSYLIWSKKGNRKLFCQGGGATPGSVHRNTFGP